MGTRKEENKMSALTLHYTILLLYPQNGMKILRCIFSCIDVSTKSFEETLCYCVVGSMLT